MRAPWVTLSPRVQKERVEEIHCSTHMGKCGHNDSHTAASSTNETYMYERRELANNTKRKRGEILWAEVRAGKQ